MNDALRFVKFLHPGKEPSLNGTHEVRWNTGGLHKRKFMRSPGEYRTGSNARSESGDIACWGEWEPQSRIEPISESAQEGPKWLHTLYYRLPDQPRWVQNTDPFVFGDRFHFTGCQQHRRRPTQLARLQPGSLVLFGSHLNERFVLDTVFVVGEGAIDPSRRDYPQMLDGKISQTYADVTIGPWYSGGVGDDEIHRLYFGATPKQPVARMFSFFPCKRLAEAPNGFARPTIDLPEITQAQTQSFKRTFLSSHEEAAALWLEVVRQVSDQGLYLGTRADLPPRRGPARRHPFARSMRRCGRPATLEQPLAKVVC